MSIPRALLAIFLLCFLLPIGISALRYTLRGDGENWRLADRSSTGLLPPAARHRPAVVRVFAARTVRWRGIFAVHAWIVVKPEGAADYTRYDYTAWGAPIRVNGFPADGRWFGQMPDLVFAADGEAAAAMLPHIDRAIQTYAWRNQGDYRAWPGPNSNTFVAAVMEAVPGITLSLPSTAIGRDYPHDGRWLRPTPSGTGFRVTLGGYVGFTLAWVEGLEFNLLGAVAGLDWREPALKLPGIGRLGMVSQGPSAALAEPR